MLIRSQDALAAVLELIICISSPIVETFINQSINFFGDF
jgi:hypothetical protein